MSVGGGLDVEALIDESRQERTSTAQNRSRLALGVSAAVTIIWAIYVTASGQWGRVGDHWASAVTMVFGSFVAGSTPQGGGAVAFPVFTKILEIPAEVARTFSLSIQSVGMTAASASILINRRKIDLRAISLAAPASLTGFMLGYFLVTKTDLPFGPSQVPGPYIKVTFTLIVASMAFVTYLGYRVQLLEKIDELPEMNNRMRAVIVLLGLIGGFASLLVGSGSDVFVYLALVVMVGLSPRVGVATSVIVMTITSLLGLVVLGIFDGHMSTILDSAGETVTMVADRTIAQTADGVRFASGTGPEAGRYDLFGLWLAAAPVVAWGAPLGSFVSSKTTDRRLVVFVVALAAAEVISTVIFLKELRTDPALAIFGVVVLIVLFALLWFLQTNRRKVLGLPEVDTEATITRGSVDVGPRLRDDLSIDEE